MKQINLLLGTVITCALLVSVQAQTQFTNGLVAYYPFNGNANDASGNGNNGTVTSAALAADRFGNPNSAYAFDGVSSLITVPDSPSLRVTNDITVTCWLSFSQTNFGGAGVRFVGKGGDCGRNYGLWLDQGAYWMFQQFAPEGGCVGCQENTAGTTPVVAALGKWYQMVGVRSGSVSRLYVDGVLVRERSPTCSASTYSGNEPLIIGAPGYSNPQQNLHLMQGGLDDIRIYNRAFSSNEVAQLYAIESGPRVDLIKAVKPSFSNLSVGVNYQLQLSGNFNTWTNEGSPFSATNASMVYPKYFDVENWSQLFFRVKVVP